MQASVRVIPVLETERLRLRRHRENDFAACCAMWADPIVVRHTSGKPQTPEEVWMKMLRYGGLWSLVGYGYWAVEEQASGEFVGELGFADFKRDVQPSLDDMPEAGWAFVSRVHGRGYATEAVKAVVAWGDQRFGDRSTCCIIHPDNAASIRVADKCGYTHWQSGTYKEHPVLIMRR